jgi:NAD(P)-dependent dehydrogenase (short-subunit alcohol dehydrogenase family)
MTGIIPPPTHVLLGAGSAVAVAYARKVCEADPARFVLVARNETRALEILADLRARGADEGSFVLAGDLGDPDAVPALAEDLFRRAGQVENVLLAYGVLGDREAQSSDLLKLRGLVDVNFVSAVLWCEAVAGQMAAQGHGRLGILGSVAGDRGRQSNYLYGATKGALERVAEGMAHRFARSPKISVTLIKPGFIDTPMTAHIPKSGPLWAPPEKIAEIAWRAMQARRVRVYAPWFWRYILLIVRALPVPVMHRTKM